MDAFSEILSGVKLNGALFFNADFSAPWGFAAPASKVLASSLAPGQLDDSQPGARGPICSNGLGRVRVRR